MTANAQRNDEPDAMPSRHSLTPDDIAAIAAAVIDRLQAGHVCRFEAPQAAVLHEAAKRLSADDVIAVAWLAHRLQAIGDTAGQWFARCVIAGLVSLGLIGLSGTLYAIKRGWISAP